MSMLLWTTMAAMDLALLALIVGGLFLVATMMRQLGLIRDLAVRVSALEARDDPPPWYLDALAIPESERESITCPRCGARSWHPMDVKHGYCARCHDWTSPR